MLCFNRQIAMLNDQQTIIKENVLSLQLNMSSHESVLEQTKSEVESLNYLTIVETVRLIQAYLYIFHPIEIF